MEQINQRENQREMWQWNKKTKGKTKGKCGNGTNKPKEKKR